MSTDPRPFWRNLFSRPDPAADEARLREEQRAIELERQAIEDAVARAGPVPPAAPKVPPRPAIQLPPPAPRPDPERPLLKLKRHPSWLVAALTLLFVLLVIWASNGAP